MQFDQLPLTWQTRIKRLRKDVARYRTERNEALRELAAMKAATTTAEETTTK